MAYLLMATEALYQHLLSVADSNGSIQIGQVLEAYKKLGLPIPNASSGTIISHEASPKIKIKLKADIVLRPDLIAHLKGMGEALEVYEETIKAINLSVFNKVTFEPSDYLSANHYQRVIDHIKANESPKTLIAMVINLLNGCSLSAETEAYKAYSAFNDSLPKVKRSYKQRDIGTVTWADLIAKREELGQKVSKMLTPNDINYNTYHQYLALCIFTMMLPLWPQEWLKTKLIEKLPSDVSNEQYTKTSRNFINLETGQMILSDCRTFQQSKGLRILTLPNDLLTVIRNWYTLTHREYLFGKYFGRAISEIMSSSAFTSMVSNIPFSNGGLTPSLIRKLYVSTFTTNGYLNDDEKSRVTILLGHSPSAHNFALSEFCSMLLRHQVTFQPSKRSLKKNKDAGSSDPIQ